MKKIYSLNPATEKVIKSYTLLTNSELDKKLVLAGSAFKKWKESTITQRSEYLHRGALLLRKNKKEYATLITREMGKTIASSLTEIEKCALVCEYFAENAADLLKDQQVKTEVKSSYVRLAPLGVIAAIMPWNFPFWQVFRAATPALVLGNTMVLKHASNVTGCSLLIERIFKDAGFPKGVFTSLIVGSSSVERVIANRYVKAVTLTGSEGAGSAVAASAGKLIKKSVLELGGSDPFIVLDDADSTEAAKNATSARLIVSGQSCIAAKRFIVQKSIADKFISLMKKAMEAKRVGDPTDPNTDVGPLSSEKILKEIDRQVKESVGLGAKIITGGKRVPGKGYFYMPTILTHIKPNMPVYKEETFGPVAAVIVVNGDVEALTVANDTRFGLGASVWTKSEKRAKLFIDGLQSGSVFINATVKSDPRLPFGGIKASGYGRELSSYGLTEFANIKTVWVEKL